MAPPVSRSKGDAGAGSKITEIFLLCGQGPGVSSTDADVQEDRKMRWLVLISVMFATACGVPQVTSAGTGQALPALVSVARTPAGTPTLPPHPAGSSLGVAVAASRSVSA